MAIQMDYFFNGVTIQKAYVRVINIAGSKEGGYGGIVGVFNDGSHEHPPVAQFYKNVPYAPDVSPFVLIYDALKIDYPDAVDAKSQAEIDAANPPPPPPQEPTQDATANS